MEDPKATYARVSALIAIRIDELREALNRHEAARRWDEHDTLERVERGLAELVKKLQ